MLKKYSSNQHVDLDLTYHLASITLLCQARRSKICFSYGCSNTSSPDSYIFNVLCIGPNSLSSTLFFNFCLYIIWASLASVDVMYMYIIITNMSIIVIIIGMAETISNVAINLWCGAKCRGTLASLPQETIVECMESLVVAEVETACRQEAPLEGQKLSALEVELGPRAQKKERKIKRWKVQRENTQFGIKLNYCFFPWFSNIQSQKIGLRLHINVYWSNVHSNMHKIRIIVSVLAFWFWIAFNRYKNEL